MTAHPPPAAAPGGNEPGGVPAVRRPRTTTRDPEALTRRLTAWLGTRLPGARAVAATVPDSNGMSSETLLFDIEHPEPPSPAAGPEQGAAPASCALRLAADPAAYTVFPRYDMARQYRTMRLVATHTDLPVPRTLWLEEDPAHLGAPFFVMARADGRVPPDVMPYTYEGIGCTTPPTPSATTWKPPVSRSSPGCTTKSRPRRPTSSPRPAPGACCTGTSRPNGATTPGSLTAARAHRSSSGASPGWPTTGRRTPVRPC